MATTEVVSWRQEDKDVGLRTTEPSRGLMTFIICTMMLTALCILQAVMWRDSLPQVPPYTARLRRPKLQFGSLAPDAAWEFRPEAMAKVRTSTMKLHPDVHLVLYKVGTQYKKDNCNFNKDISDVHCQTDYNTKISHYNTCAVVGNSGVLLESRCGAEIDSKDYVVRIDIPVVRGYEKDVGERTSMTVLNLSTPKRLQSSARLKNRTQDVYESRLRNIGGTALVMDKRSRSNMTSLARKYHLSFSLYTVRGRLVRGINPLASRLASRKMGSGIPTIGLVTVLMATAFCDHPYLYGFFPFQKDANNTPIPYHYYPGDYIKPIKQNEGGRHNMSREYDFYRNLHKQGVLKTQVGPCEEHTALATYLHT
ncbi:alpha-2,8-sialyltransferase 8B-like [Branchiostoma floridae]|uniref:Alpha-2,8-sialyltransferase 8B-like n=1 Tax=Branchiostoma floridae TaxID=7739 RepID=A0A9J7L7K4_BRAFL|nr:alpha-2,8-sialyltransferase 8B-like [Branchiostoma floridae]